MPNYQLELIRQYCDTTGVRLSSRDRDLLCMVLENPDKYDGFTSELYTERGSGKNVNGRWDSATKHQYRINIDSSLSIDERYLHSTDGYVQDEYWDWDNAWHYTEIREIIRIFRKIESEL